VSHYAPTERSADNLTEGYKHLAPPEQRQAKYVIAVFTLSRTNSSLVDLDSINMVGPSMLEVNTIHSGQG